MGKKKVRQQHFVCRFLPVTSSQRLAWLLSWEVYEDLQAKAYWKLAPVLLAGEWEMQWDEGTLKE